MMRDDGLEERQVDGPRLCDNQTRPRGHEGWGGLGMNSSKQLLRRLHLEKKEKRPHNPMYWS